MNCRNSHPEGKQVPFSRMQILQDGRATEEFEILFGELAGDWRLTRETGDGTRFTGIARFTTAGTGRLLLEEEGQVFLPGNKRLRAGRSWQWVLPGGHENAHCLEIRYPEERGGMLYHRLKLLAVGNSGECFWQGAARHVCRDDLYDGDYELARNRMRIRHRITGPNKDLIVDSLYLRDSVPEPGSRT
jgi:Family of unknown function (DUF6314)